MKIVEVVRKQPRLRRGIDTLMAAAQESANFRDWYQKHESIIDELFGEDSKLFKSILAATSQAASVLSNVGLALKAYQQMKRGEPFVGYLPQVIKNLDRIRGEQELFGPKISEFGGAMQSQAGQVAVDRHIGELLFGTMKPNRAMIEKAKQVITQIAQRLGWEPREVQASLWAYNQMLRGGTPESVYSYHTVLNNRRKEIQLIRRVFQDIQQEPMAA
jgi:hypothetical protein